MRKKLMLTYILIIAIISIIIGYTAISTSQKHLESQIMDSFIRESTLLRDILKNEYIDKNNTDFISFSKYYSDQLKLRITLINFDGMVLADSEKEELENHSGREEFKQAIAKGSGFSKRYSDTMQTYYFYYAISLEYNNMPIVLRISTPLLEIEILESEILKSSINGLILGICVTILVAVILTKIFFNPIKELTNAAEEVAMGNYNKTIYVNSKDEVGKLTVAFNTMLKELRYTIAQLKDRNLKLESILNSMTNGVIAVDSHYNIILINPLCYKLLGIEDSDIYGKALYEVIRNSHVFDLLEKSTSTGQYIADEILYESNNPKILRIYANPISQKRADHGSIGTVLVIDDVTQIRKLEQMRSEFVSNVTHELKTPLTSIKGFIDTLKNGAIKDLVVAERFLDIIDIEADRLYSLIQEILTLSEIESRDKDINMKQVNISELIRTVEKLLQPLADKKDIVLTIERLNDIPMLFCNKERIEQLIINLVDNAIKYTEKGQVSVTFSCVQKQLNITVTDTGIGIPSESIPRIFERFYRVDKGRSRKIGGTGLGLSIVKHIILLYKGKINVTSKIGTGSKFEVILPILI